MEARLQQLNRPPGVSMFGRTVALYMIVLVLLVVQMPPIVLTMHATRDFDLGGIVPEDEDPMMIIVAGISSWGETSLMILSAVLLAACRLHLQFFLCAAFAGLAAVGTGVFGIYGMARSFATSICDEGDEAAKCEIGLRKGMAGSCWKVALSGPFFFFIAFWYFFKARPGYVADSDVRRRRRREAERGYEFDEAPQGHQQPQQPQQQQQQPPPYQSHIGGRHQQSGYSALPPYEDTTNYYKQ